MAKLKSANFPLDKILGDRSGKELDVVLRALSNEFGTVKICNGIASEAGSILSALTKICCFLSPASEAQLGQHVKEACAEFAAVKHARLGRKFHWRVFDCHLMRRGGRWDPK